MEDVLTFTNISELENTKKFSISAWVKPKILSSYDGIFGIAQNGDANYRLGFSLGPNGSNIVIYLANGNNSYGTTGLNLLEEGRWNHWFMTFDGSQNSNAERLKFYLNGAEQILNYTGSIPSTTAARGYLASIGSEHAINGFFNGTIDDVAIWATRLSDDEVYKIYARQFPKYSGSYTSKPFSLGYAGPWEFLNWESSLPFAKELSLASGTDLENGLVLSENMNGPLGINFSQGVFKEAKNFNGTSDVINVP